MANASRSAVEAIILGGRDVGLDVCDLCGNDGWEAGIVNNALRPFLVGMNVNDSRTRSSLSLQPPISGKYASEITSSASNAPPTYKKYLAPGAFVTPSSPARKYLIGK